MRLCRLRHLFFLPAERPLFYCASFAAAACPFIALPAMERVAADRLRDAILALQSLDFVFLGAVSFCGIKIAIISPSQKRKYK
jgi:hypothetical protein